MCFSLIDQTFASICNADLQSPDKAAGEGSLGARSSITSSFLVVSLHLQQLYRVPAECFAENSNDLKIKKLRQIRGTGQERVIRSAPRESLAPSVFMR